MIRCVYKVTDHFLYFPEHVFLHWFPVGPAAASRVSQKHNYPKYDSSLAAGVAKLTLHWDCLNSEVVLLQKPHTWKYLSL